MKQLRFDKSILPSLAACLLLPVYLELALHLFVYRGVSARIVYPLLFALAAGFALFALVSLLPKRAGGIVLCVLTGIFVLYFEIQFVYNSIFGEFMSVRSRSARPPSPISISRCSTASGRRSCRCSSSCYRCLR